MQAIKHNHRTKWLVLVATGEAKYGRAADAALEFFALHGAAPESGLFAWGEHAQYDFHTDAWFTGNASVPGWEAVYGDMREHELAPFDKR